MLLNLKKWRCHQVYYKHYLHYNFNICFPKPTLAKWAPE